MTSDHDFVLNEEELAHYQELQKSDGEELARNYRRSLIDKTKIPRTETLGESKRRNSEIPTINK